MPHRGVGPDEHGDMLAIEVAGAAADLLGEGVQHVRRLLPGGGEGPSGVRQVLRVKVGQTLPGCLGEEAEDPPLRRQERRIGPSHHGDVLGIHAVSLRRDNVANRLQEGHGPEQYGGEGPHDHRQVRRRVLGQGIALHHRLGRLREEVGSHRRRCRRGEGPDALREHRGRHLAQPGQRLATRVPEERVIAVREPCACPSDAGDIGRRPRGAELALHLSGDARGEAHIFDEQRGEALQHQ
mmetsp:Transcript_34346/g.99006  ORF Transcript_34346/g.99006 Transcript_34346/m.99006 type:complete len:239 (-) Transcript_34346:259-975(-)